MNIYIYIYMHLHLHPLPISRLCIIILSSLSTEPEADILNWHSVASPALRLEKLFNSPVSKEGQLQRTDLQPAHVCPEPAATHPRPIPHTQ